MEHPPSAGPEKPQCFKAAQFKMDFCVPESEQGHSSSQHISAEQTAAGTPR